MLRRVRRHAVDEAPCGQGQGRVASGDSSTGVDVALKQGDMVVLTGLKKSPELNGSRGIVLDDDAKGGRLLVRLASGKKVTLKPANLALHTRGGDA